MKKYFGEYALIITTIIWGGTFVLIKGALDDVSPMLFLASRFTLALLVLLPLWKIIFKKVDAYTIKAGLILGLIYGFSFALQTKGLQYTSSTKSGFITGTFVVFTPLLQYIIEKRKPTKGNYIGVLLVICGLILLSSKGTSLFSIITELGSNFNLGDLLTLFCAFLYALYIVYLDMISSKTEYLPLIFMQIFVTSVIGILSVIIFSYTGFEEIRFVINNNVIVAFFYTAIIATMITTFLQTKYQRFVTPVKASIIFSMEPIFAAFFAFLIIDERITSFGVIGCALIFTGLIISEIWEKVKWKELRF